MRILFVYTVEASLRTAVRGQIGHLVERGHDVHVAVSPDEVAREWVEAEGGNFHGVPMTRSSRDIGGDVRALCAIAGVIRAEQPDVVVCGSPKASLLATLAGRYSSRPVVYFMHGLRLEGASGMARRALVALEWLTCRLATRVVAVGEGLRLAAIQAGVVNPKAIEVVGDGSANGIDTKRFQRASRVDVPFPTFGFVGRIARDKGISDLVRAWAKVRVELPTARLLVVGAADSDSCEDVQLVSALEDAGAEMRGFVPDPAKAIMEMDILVLPSHREGLPTVVLEAASASVPSIMYSCTGSDVVEDGVTGCIVSLGDWEGLADAMANLGVSRETTQRMGRQARKRVKDAFEQARVWSAYEQYYVELVRQTSGGEHD